MCGYEGFCREYLPVENKYLIRWLYFEHSLPAPRGRERTAVEFLQRRGSD